MKRLLFLLCCIALLLTACNHAPAPENTTNITMHDEDNLPIEEQTTQAEPEETPIEETITVTPNTQGGLSLSVTNLEIIVPTYGDDEQYELKMLLTATQYAQLHEAALRFNPRCEDPTNLAVRLNKQDVETLIAECNEEQTITLPLDDFVEGQNVITLLSDTEKTYELDDIALLLTDQTGAQETLETKSHLFKPEETEPATIKNLPDVTLSNAAEFTFTLAERQLGKDLHLAYTLDTDEGTLLVTLNDHNIDLDEGDNQLRLPKEYLIKGKNTLLFIGTPK